MNREAWLNQAVGMLKEKFELDLPEFRISVGLPKGGKEVIGQAWAKKHTSDGSVMIFVSPVISDPTKVLSVVLHELLHAQTFKEGEKPSHRGRFVELAKKVGFMKPWKSTPETEALLKTLDEMAKVLGDYPQPAFSLKVEGEDDEKKGSTLVLWVCECKPKPVKIRYGRKEDLKATCDVCHKGFQRGEP